jgi:hypothetical protein
MAGSDAPVRRPTFIPNGFEIRRTMQGKDVIGIGIHPSQFALVYTKGWERDDWVYPLIFFVRPDSVGPALAATADHPGTPVDLERPDLAGIYHDGWWTLERPPTEADGPNLIWETSRIHSVTVSGPDFKFAIRGAKVWAPVSASELIQMAKSAL